MPETKVVRAGASVWDEESGSSLRGFVEVEDVLDGTVSVCITDEDTDELRRAWLTPAKARRVATALIEAAQGIEDLYALEEDA